MASLLGSPGQSNYAAANAFLDALSHHRRSCGLTGLGVNWGPWADVGMAARLHSRLQANGESMIDPASGVRLFSLALEQDVPQLGAMRVDLGALWGRVSGSGVSGEASRSADDGPARRRACNWLDPASASRPGPSARRTLGGSCAGAGGERAGACCQFRSRTQGFAHLGLDSLASIELRVRLEQALDLPVWPTRWRSTFRTGPLTAHLP